MRLLKLTTRQYTNDLDKRVYAYYRLIGWYCFQIHLRDKLYSLIIPARRTK